MNEQDKLALVLHLASRHGANRERYEETNPGVGFRAPFGRDSYLGVGAYRNSLGRTSVYGGIGKEFLTLGDMLGLRLNAGAITGYGDSVLPFVIPEARVNLPGRSDLLMQYIPEVSHGNLKTDPVLGFSLRIPFGGGSRRPSFRAKAAKVERSLTPAERNIVQYHRDTIAQGNVGRDERGRPVTVFSTGIRVPEGPNAGKFVAVPGYVDGQIVRDEDALYRRWKAEIDAGTWPMYPSGAALNRRSREIHAIMDYEGEDL